MAMAVHLGNVLGDRDLTDVHFHGSDLRSKKIPHRGNTQLDKSDSVCRQPSVVPFCLDQLRPIAVRAGRLSGCLLGADDVVLAQQMA